MGSAMLWIEVRWLQCWDWDSWVSGRTYTITREESFFSVWWYNPVVKALLIGLGLFFTSLFSGQDLLMRFCTQLCFSLGFIILRLKITPVISMLSRDYWRVLVCVIHQEGQVSTPGKSGRQNHLLHPGGPSKFSVKLVFLHYMHCQDFWETDYFLKSEVFLSSKYLFDYSNCLTQNNVGLAEGHMDL